MTPSTSDTDQAQATFGRYAETPYDQMTPEQQEGYRILAKAEGGELQGRRRSGSTIRTSPRRWRRWRTIFIHRITHSPSASGRSPSASFSASGTRRFR